MSNEVEERGLTLGMDRQIVVSPEQMETIKSTIFPDATDDELKLFIYHCQRKGTHPMDKLIHPIKRAGKVAFQASIDFLRAESESAGDYRGMRQPVYEFDENNRLESATVTVFRQIGTEVVEFTATAYWSEFYPGEKLGFMWDKMPRHMLAKCAEALARRMAWPKKLADLYTPEEMAQADNPNTAAQNKQQTRSSSVKPAQRPQQGKVIDAETVSLDDEITALLAQLTGGDYSSMDELLKEVSYYHDKGKAKDFSFGMERLSATSSAWKEKVLAKLKAKAAERQPGEEG